MPRPTRTGCERHALARSTGPASLWSAVISQALSDAAGTSGSVIPSTGQDRDAARAFLRGSSPSWRASRDLALTLAGVDPEAFATRALPRLEAAWREADAAAAARYQARQEERAAA